MSKIDLSHYQQPELDQTVVTMPDGSEITLRPLMQLGPENDEILLTVIGDLEKTLTAAQAKKAKGARGGRAKAPAKEAEGQGVSLEFSDVIGLMRPIGQLLRAAAPTPEDAERIASLPMMARFEIIMGYFEDQDLGGLFPSAS